MSEPEKPKILEVFYKRAPNALTLDNIAYDFPDVDRSALKRALSELVEAGIVVERKGREKVKDDYLLPFSSNRWRNVLHR